MCFRLYREQLWEPRVPSERWARGRERLFLREYVSVLNRTTRAFRLAELGFSYACTLHTRTWTSVLAGDA